MTVGEVAWLLAGLTIVVFLVVNGLDLIERRRRNSWEVVAEGNYDKVAVMKHIYGSTYSTILFTDGRSCPVVDIVLPTLGIIPGTYITISKTKRGNNFKIETPIPPSSCL